MNYDELLFVLSEIRNKKQSRLEANRATTMPS